MKVANIFTTGLFIAAMTLLSGCSDDADSASATNGSSATPVPAGLGPSVPTQIITHRDFRIGFDPGSAEVFDTDGNYNGALSVEIVISADDINDLLVEGQTVNVRTEWGTFTDDRDSCVLSNGSCSVTWLPGDKLTAPSSASPASVPPAESAECRVAFTAWTQGEEKFTDVNDNGLFDTGETFTDLPEPYLDINESGLFSDAFNGYTKGWDIDFDFNGDGDLADFDIDFNRNNIIDAGDTDINGNGVVDPGDTDINGNGLIDLADIDFNANTSIIDYYRITTKVNPGNFDIDFNHNGIIDNGYCNSDGVCELIDLNGDGIHNNGDGLYNGSLCGIGNTQCSITTSTTIWTTSYLLIGDSVDPRCFSFKP